MDSFPGDVQSGLLNVYSRFDVREIPKPGNFLQLITSMAKFYFLRKPAAAISEIKSGIPDLHSDFWRRMTVADLYALYRALQVSTAKVLAMLDDTNVANQTQERIFGYLQQFIGNMQEDEVRNFLRFVTGSSVSLSRTISVSFNGLEGLARRPIGHTCSCMLELSTSYTSYLEFVTEFKYILNNPEFSWKMDATYIVGATILLFGSCRNPPFSFNTIIIIFLVLIILQEKSFFCEHAQSRLHLRKVIVKETAVGDSYSAHACMKLLC